MTDQRPEDLQPEMQPLEQSSGEPLGSAPGDAPPLSGATSGPAGGKRLYRSSDQKVFLGVCGGLGEYFEMDPTLVRIIFVVTTLLGGASIAVYAVLALIMPDEDSLDLDPRTAAQKTINDASEEVRKGVTVVTERVRGMAGRGGATGGGTGVGTGAADGHSTASTAPPSVTSPMTGGEPLTPPTDPNADRSDTSDPSEEPTTRIPPA